MDALLEVRDLKTYFYTYGGVVKAVDGVSFQLLEGEVLGLVGESGCGKSVSALSVMRLVAGPPGKIVNGEVLFQGEDLLSLTDEQMRKTRGNKIAMVFQEPMTSLNPVLTIGLQITESLREHMGMSKNEARLAAVERLIDVGMPDPERTLISYPHQLSGGMRQRVMIAIALSCDPKIIIADEPTTALDVTIQAQILNLMKRLSQEKGIALIIITHNLGVIARYCDRVNIMYAGKIVESGLAAEIYQNPKHPYTMGLLKSVPRLDLPRKEKLNPIEGQPPDLANLPAGCSFRERCTHSISKCALEIPPLAQVAEAHSSACWVADDLSLN